MRVSGGGRAGACDAGACDARTRVGRPVDPSRLGRVGLVLLLVAGLLTVSATVAPAPDAAAATVTIGTISAQMADHLGENNGANGNCITYSPGSARTASGFVSSPGEAITAHGYQGGRCPAALSTTTQSAVGFRPATTTSAVDGAAFLIGRVVHYNNPVTTNDRFFTGKFNTVLGGFAVPNTLSFNWRMDETPNTGGGGCCDDQITFTDQISDITLTQGGQTYRLVILGFQAIGAGATCPASPAGQVVNNFNTVEGQQTNACLYATLVQTRTLTIVKNVAGPAPAGSRFPFTSAASLAGSDWATGSVTLAPGTPTASVTRELVRGDTVTVTEADPGDDRWALTDLTCTQIGAGGQPEPVPGVSVNRAARQVVLAAVPAPPLTSQPGITCSYTNTYTPRATLTLRKVVSTGPAAPSLWTLTATGSGAQTSAVTPSGTSGSPAVTNQRVPAGAYTLSELGIGAASTGYTQVGAWSCTTGAGTAIPVTGSTVTLPNSAPGSQPDAVTCTVTNRQATGTLEIAKTVDGPSGAFTGGSGKSFTGTYSCGTGFTGSFSVSIGTPFQATGIPAGRSCTVTEDPPTGGLANASYAWAPATYSTQPVTITADTTARVTISNQVIQRTGTFAISKTITGPGGYVGGPGRVFPVAYRCTLTGGPTTSGTLNLASGQPVSPASAVPTGSVCTLTETLTATPTDFVDPSYVWGSTTVTPNNFIVGDGTTAQVTVTNTYTRQTGSLVLAKVVTGDGYTGGTGANFLVGYDCGNGFTGTRRLANGGSGVTIDNLPAGVGCTLTEIEGTATDPALWPSTSLLAPGYTWGEPSWRPGSVVTIPAKGTVTATVTNPTVPVFGQVSVTKALAGEVKGVRAGATFVVTVTCGGRSFPLTLTADGTELTGDVPVGASCQLTEQDPDPADLVDPSYAWAATPAPQTVTVTASGQVVPVTVTNTVNRATGQLTITKAPITPAGVVDPGRVYDIDYTCRYGDDPPVTGTVSLRAGETASPVTALLDSLCTVTESATTLDAPPSATDPSYVWLPPTYSDEQPVLLTATTPPVTVTNRINQLTGSFEITKAVTGNGKDGGYTPGDTFTFQADCGPAGTFEATLADGESFQAPDVPAGTTCTVTETGTPVAPPAFGWDPVQFEINGQPADPATFIIGDSGAPVQVNAINPITLRLAAVTVTKTVTGETSGLATDAPPFQVTLNCGIRGTLELQVPADGSAVQENVPVGATCEAVESDPTGGLVDASYAWGTPVYTPASGRVTVGPDGATIGISNPIVRVTGPLVLVKTFDGPQGVVDPARSYPISWSCRYEGREIASGTDDVTATPDGIQVADNLPLTSECTATEADLGAPSADPSYRWLPPVITGTTVSRTAASTITVANELTRDIGTVTVRKEVTGETAGYVRTGEDFTLHGRCVVPGHPEIAPLTSDGTIAAGGSVVIPTVIGWQCTGLEDSPGQNLLKDASYGWGPPVYEPADPFTLTRENPNREFVARNPVVRVTGDLRITKAVNDPDGVVTAAVTFTGGYSCRYGTEPAVTGTWSITGETGGTVDAATEILAGSVCTVTEDDPNAATPNGLPDGSDRWATPVIGGPVTVVAGGSVTVPVTNSVQRLWAGLQISKTVVDPAGGVVPDAAFPGEWRCTLGDQTYGGRFTVGANDTAVAFSPADQLVPAASTCSIIEDTLGSTGLRDGSFAWEPPSYLPATVVLTADATETLGVTNTVRRVYADLLVSKAISGPADGKVDPERLFDGTVSCQYRSDDPVVIPWAASTATPASLQGVLVGSVCIVAGETAPGATGGPVTGDPSYVWGTPQFGGPVTVAPPTDPAPTLPVTNTTDRLGAFTVSKASDPASGTTVLPGSTITYTVVVTSTGEAPVHDVVVSDDLTAVLPSATIVDGSITAPDGTTATLDGNRLVWQVGTVPNGTTSTLTYQVTVNPGAAGVILRNLVTATGDVPPTDCATADAGQQACFTEHPTPLAPTLTKEPIGDPQRDPSTGLWTVRYRLAATNPNPAADVPYSLSDTLGFPPGVTITGATVTLLPAGVTPADPAWDGVANTLIAQDVTLPAGVTHSYEVQVTATIPLDTQATALSCATPGASGAGLFNQAALQSLGSTVTAQACQSVPVELVADKTWVINGQTYPNGSQPAGFSATLTLGGTPLVWRTEYPFPAGTTIGVGEQVTVPANCSGTGTGVGAVQPTTAFTQVAVTNTLTCADPPGPVPPVPVNPAGPVLPVAPVVPVVPYTPYAPSRPYTPYTPTVPLTTLPATGFDVPGFLGWATLLLGAGAALLVAGRRPGRAGR